MKRFSYIQYFFGTVLFVFSFLCFIPAAQANPTECWTDYPNAGAVIPGFPDKSTFASSFCWAKSEECGDSSKTSKPAAIAANGGFGCPNTGKTQCCMVPEASTFSCYKNYSAAERINISKTECVEDQADNCKDSGAHFIAPKGEFGCTGNLRCCATMKAAEEASVGTGAVGSAATWQTSGPGLQLVGCTATGNCEIKDIVTQAVYFAQFIMGISGALFLIAFVWGGAMYTFSFGRSEWVNKGRDAMVKSCIGIVFILSAWTVVTYVAQSLGYSAT